MRSFPSVLATQALAYGLEVHNYYRPPYYAEVLIPAKVAGCMLRGLSEDVQRFLLLFEPGAVEVDELQDLMEVMEVHQLGMQRRNALTAVCFPDWQLETEEYA